MASSRLPHGRPERLACIQPRSCLLNDASRCLTRRSGSCRAGRCCVRSARRPGESQARGLAARLSCGRGTATFGTGPTHRGGTPCSVPRTPPRASASRSTGCGGSRWTRTRGGAPRGVVRRPVAGCREMAVPASFNDIAADAAVRDYFGDVWYQTHRPGPARLGRPADRRCTSSRRRTAPRSGSTTPRWSRTRAATPRSRPTSPRTSTAGRGGADHRRSSTTR